MNAVLVFTDFGVLRATYRGGPYIELYTRTGDQPQDVINVYDYGADRPVIENTPQAVLAAIVEWLEEGEPDVVISGAWLLNTAGQAPAVGWAWDGEDIGVRLWER